VAAAPARAGWLEFGRPGVQIPHRVEPEIRAYQPHDGLLVLFPSYFYHHTIPFTGSGRRISMAFDVLPED